ncbi:BrnT family toxin [Aurantimonas sp. VKM B-3413]|uniref:BrnT family toxin n=1 Tax=Aurantimonas sp. VKM B-3413 TaxID=2779401 RepID=UPI001E488DEC|nr:BrnT family toxin [Aurantimonas sp. VKM B-3413]MCB8839193.1 BrnT family toxin [Aurantimonas sp. VKM B-3413]
MQFEWDDKKNRDNVAKHGMSFEQAARIFDGFTVDWIDDRFAYGEIREISVGMIDGAAVVVVVHTDRAGVCRIISARPALRHERKRYETEIRKAFDL